MSEGLTGGLSGMGLSGMGLSGMGLSGLSPIGLSGLSGIGLVGLSPMGLSCLSPMGSMGIGGVWVLSVLGSSVLRRSTSVVCPPMTLTLRSRTTALPFSIQVALMS